MDNVFRETVSEALLRKAVIDDHINELNAIPPSDESAAIYTFSVGHEARMHRLFKKERRRELRHSFLQIARRVAVTLLFLCTFLFGLLMINPDVRAAVLDVIIERFDRYTQYTFGDRVVSESEYPEDILWLPDYVPDGFTKGATKSTFFMNVTEYENEDAERLSFDCGFRDAMTISTDNEYATYWIVNENDVEYHVYERTGEDNKSSIIWTRDEYAMKVSGRLPIEELLRMAQSVSPH